MRIVQAGLAAALLAGTTLSLGAAPATAKMDPNSALLANAVKKGMQTKMRKLVPGLAVKRVVCWVPKRSKKVAGRCTARFLYKKANVSGVYKVRASLNQLKTTLTKKGQLRQRGALEWSTTGVTCVSMATKKRIPCSS